MVFGAVCAASIFCKRTLSQSGEACVSGYILKVLRWGLRSNATAGLLLSMWLGRAQVAVRLGPSAQVPATSHLEQH